MSWLRRLIRALTPGRDDGAVDAELRAHLDLEAEELARQGLSPAEAHRRARLAFGSVEKARAESRDIRRLQWIAQSLRDVRYACRTFVRAPGFSVLAIVSLGLGVGFNVAVFALVDAVLLRPLPVAQPATLVDIYTSGADRLPLSTSSLPDLHDIDERSSLLEGVIGYSPMVAPVSGPDGTGLVLGEVVTGNYFDVLGVVPRLGRTLGARDASPGSPPTAVISSRYWRSVRASNPAIVGQALSIHGRPFTIVGVLPEGFSGMLPLLAPAIWVSVVHEPDIEVAGISEAVPSPTGSSRLDRRGQRWLFAKGRVAPTASFDQARAELDTIAAALAVENPQTNRDRSMTLRPSGATRFHPDADGILRVLLTGSMAAVAVLLLITCTNVAGAVIVRGTGRTREMAVRLALGARRGRLVRQLLAENLVLGVSGAVLGVAMAWWLTSVFDTVRLPLPVPLTLDLRMDIRVLVFAVALTLVTGLLVGIGPALSSSRVSIRDTLAVNVGSVAGRRRRWSPSEVLVVLQIAMTSVLLIVAAFLLRGLGSARSVDVGFPTAGLAIVSADPSLIGYTSAETRLFWQRVETAIRQLPGVQGVARGSRFPFSFNFQQTTIAVPGHQKSPDEMGTAVMSAVVTADFFRTLGVPLVHGRSFGTQDAPGRPAVAIVNQAFANRYWPDGAVGRQVFERTLSSGRSFEVVGVAANHKLQSVSEGDRPAIYFAAAQQNSDFNAILARTTGDQSALLADMRRAILQIEPRTPIFEAQTMDDQIASTLIPQRIGASLAAILGSVAVLLSVIGLYGVIALAVSRRTRELAIRIALGATRPSVLALVGRRGLVLTAVGLAGGVLGGCAVLTALANLGVLYGVGLVDPAAWTGVVGVVALAAGLAHLQPARRALSLDPIHALRNE